MSIEAMKQALEALEELKCDTFHPAKVFKHNPTINALRQAIEQAEKQRAEIIRPRGKSWLTVNPEGKVEIRKIK